MNVGGGIAEHLANRSIEHLHGRVGLQTLARNELVETRTRCRREAFQHARPFLGHHGLGDRMRYHVEQSHLAVDPLGYITRPTDRFDTVLAFATEIEAWLAKAYSTTTAAETARFIGKDVGKPQQIRDRLRCF